MLIGKMFCDSYLNYKLSLTPYKCYNLANDVHCYHIQEDSSFSDIVSKSPELIEEYTDEFNDSINYLQTLSKQKKENEQKTVKKNRNVICLEISHTL
jgi:hypothetical protein